MHTEERLCIIFNEKRENEGYWRGNSKHKHAISVPYGGRTCHCGWAWVDLALPVHSHLSCIDSSLETMLQILKEDDFTLSKLQQSNELMKKKIPTMKPRVREEIILQSPTQRQTCQAPKKHGDTVPSEPSQRGLMSVTVAGLLCSGHCHFSVHTVRRAKLGYFFLTSRSMKVWT